MDVNSSLCLDCCESHWKQNTIGDLVMHLGTRSWRQVYQVLQNARGPYIWDVSKQNKQHSHRPLKNLNQSQENKIQADVLITRDKHLTGLISLKALMALHNDTSFFLRKQQGRGLIVVYRIQQVLCIQVPINLFVYLLYFPLTFWN